MALAINGEIPLEKLLDGLDKKEIAFIMFPYRYSFYVVWKDDAEQDTFYCSKTFSGTFKKLTKESILKNWGDGTHFDYIVNGRGAEISDSMQEYERSSILDLAKQRLPI